MDNETASRLNAPSPHEPIEPSDKRFQFGLRALCVSIVLSAIIFGSLRSRNSYKAVLTILGITSMCGALWQRSQGGRGILGGAIGGCLGLTAAGIIKYYMVSAPNAVDYLGTTLTLTLFATTGFASGTIVGTVVWVFAELVQKGWNHKGQKGIASEQAPCSSDARELPDNDAGTQKD